MTAAVLLVAIVAEDPTVMRNAPRDDGAPQATLWRGDWLEVRGETAGFLEVYDHRHERPGFVRAGVVRVHRLDEATAPELRAVVRFLRDAPGSESLGIGYAALYLRAAPAGVDSSEVLAAIGTMASRLARRASARQAAGRDRVLPGASPAASATAAQVEVAEHYGVHFRSIESMVGGGRARLCYDGEAWERVRAAGAAPAIERARAALFLAGDSCAGDAAVAAVAAPADQRAWNDRRVDALGGVDPAALPAYLAGRVRLRRAEALAWRAYDEARKSGLAGRGSRGGSSDGAARAEGAAVRELALVDRGLLAPEDLDTFHDVAVRVASARWAVETPPRDTGKRRFRIAVEPRATGESCVRVLESSVAPGGAGAGGAAAASRLVGERCTYGVVWPSALRWSPAGDAATIAVQPLPSWTELWVIRRGRAAPLAAVAPANGNAGPAPTPSPAPAATWTIEPLVPAARDPGAGYVETAGFSPDGAHLLVVRESRAPGHAQRRFQVLSLATLAVEKQAGGADRLLAFKRWSAAWWRSGTLALR
ncbi:MAG TPA: hypothetical protein VFH68_14015 [Polyangia bacterium]|nr:hypothetical protein [Polyangia bacterium]